MTSLMPSYVRRNDQLMNDNATVKKLGEAGQPCLTPRCRLNSGPTELSNVTFAFASKYRVSTRLTIDGVAPIVFLYEKQVSFVYCTLMETFFNRFVFCLLLHLFAMEKVAPVPLFRPSCGRMFHKNSKVWANFKNISCFRMLTATPAKLFKGTTSL